MSSSTKVNGMSMILSIQLDLMIGRGMLFEAILVYEEIETEAGL